MNIEKYFCDQCSNNLPINNFYSYKKSICKNCVNKKVKCDFCSKNFDSSILSKQLKSKHNTSINRTESKSTSYNRTENKSTSDNRTENKSTSNTRKKNKSTSNTRTKNKSTSDNRTEIKSTSSTKTDSNKNTSPTTKENKSTSNINNSNKTYDEKDIDKINLLLAKARILQDKISLGSIKKKEKRDFTTIINKLFKLKYFDYELCDELLDQIRWKEKIWVWVCSII